MYITFYPQYAQQILLEMKHIEFRELFENEFQFKESSFPSLIINIPESVQDDGWSVLPVMATNIVSSMCIFKIIVYVQITKKEVDRFKKFEDNTRIPLRGARVVASRSAGPLFHKKVTVEGADEDLSFNIMIPPPPQGICKYISLSDF